MTYSTSLLCFRQERKEGGWFGAALRTPVLARGVAGHPVLSPTYRTVFNLTYLHLGAVRDRVRQSVRPLLWLQLASIPPDN